MKREAIRHFYKQKEEELELEKDHMPSIWYGWWKEYCDSMQHIPGFDNPFSKERNEFFARTTPGNNHTRNCIHRIQDVRDYIENRGSFAPYTQIARWAEKIHAKPLYTPILENDKRFFDEDHHISPERRMWLDKWTPITMQELAYDVEIDGPSISNAATKLGMIIHVHFTDTLGRYPNIEDFAQIFIWDSEGVRRELAKAPEVWLSLAATDCIRDEITRRVQTGYDGDDALLREILGRLPK